MKIGVIADDFTGASDIALTLAEAGMTTAQFIGIPKGSVPPVEAGVVALKSRSAPVGRAVADSLSACDWLLAQGAEQIIFKVCSTFDSTADGNIGPVLDALIAKMGPGPVITCPAFPENGRSVYQGHLFVNDVLLNECGMQDHPLTPMKDPDLRRVLASQSVKSIGHIPAPTVMQGAGAIRKALPDGPVIVDAIRDADLIEIGKAAKGAKLLCGGSGIALGLPANFGTEPKTPAWDGLAGPAVVISGSCSRATRGQVAKFQDSHPSREVTAEDAVSGRLTAETLADWVLSQSSTPLVYSSADPQVVQDAQNKYGRAASSNAIERLFSSLAALLAEKGVARFVVAGGETSGAVVNGLEAKCLRIGPRIAAGVPLIRVEHKPIALALKSGNFGEADFFHSALRLMETTS